MVSESGRPLGVHAVPGPYAELGVVWGRFAASWANSCLTAANARRRSQLRTLPEHPDGRAEARAAHRAVSAFGLMITDRVGFRQSLRRRGANARSACSTATQRPSPCGPLVCTHSASPRAFQRPTRSRGVNPRPAMTELRSTPTCSTAALRCPQPLDQRPPTSTHPTNNPISAYPDRPIPSPLPTNNIRISRPPRYPPAIPPLSPRSTNPDPLARIPCGATAAQIQVSRARWSLSAR
jgi:hypothetical protein